MKLNPFHYAMSLMETLYGITMQEDAFEEIAIIAFNLIGNKRVKLNRYKICVSRCDDGVQLPCDADQIEAVTTNIEEGNYVTNTSNEGDSDSFWIENYIESRKGFRDPHYIGGEFIKYELVGDKLYFDRPYGPINILYKTELLDEDGLPQITDKEATAIATYCAYIFKFREGLMTNNPNIINLANTLKQQWNIQCDQARVDHYMSQNEWDQVLETKTDYDRKVHNKSFKVFR